MTNELSLRDDPDQERRAFGLSRMERIDEIIALACPEGSPGVSINNKDLDLISDLKRKIENIVIREAVTGQPDFTIDPTCLLEGDFKIDSSFFAGLQDHRFLISFHSGQIKLHKGCAGLIRPISYSHLETQRNPNH